MKLTRLIGPALLGTCLYGAVTNSFPTNEEKDAESEIDATNEVERAGCVAAYGLKLTLGLTEGEIHTALTAPQRLNGETLNAGVTADGRANTPGSPSLTIGHLQGAAGWPWGVRGAWDDDFYFDFADGWFFPLGTNRVSGVVVDSQGALAASSFVEPFVSLPFAAAIVPREGAFAAELTPSNSYAFSWTNVRPGRLATETVDGCIELRRNGDYVVSTNGVVVEEHIRGNPYPEVPIGQDDDYRDWVDEQVGVGLTNGLYKFTASFPIDPPEATLLTVGTNSVIVTNADDYVFVLEKGVEYTFATWPYDPTVEYWMQDDVGPDAPVFASWWWEDGTGEWTTDGGWSWLYQPSRDWAGRCIWMPTFRGAPDVSHIGVGEEKVFFAELADYKYADAVAYHWTSSDENVVIASPDSSETRISFVSLPSWRESSLRVTASLDADVLASDLTFSYGENSQPQVHLALELPNAILLNSNEVDSAKLCQLTVSFASDVETNGVLRLSCLNGNDKVALWTTTNKTTSVALSQTWQVPGFDGFVAYVEGVKTSEELGDVRFKVEFIPETGARQELIRQMTVVEIGEVSLPGVTSEGLVVLLGTSVDMKIDCFPSAARLYLSGIWETRRVRCDGSFDAWSISSMMSSDNEVVVMPASGGIYHVRVSVGVGLSAHDERIYHWLADDDYSVSFRRRGDLRAFGVCSSLWQKTLWQCAMAHVGSEAYLTSVELPAMYSYPSYPISDLSPRCNIFVAHRIVESSLPALKTRGMFNQYPPLANDWGNSNYTIPGWEVVTWYPEPGYVVSEPNFDNPPGHVGILDYDGYGISAGGENVNRKFEACNGETVFRRYIGDL